MKCVLISDTHGKHDSLQIPDGDTVIHAGDCSMTGSETELKSFINWFGKLSHKNKILIMGNHDLSFDKQEVYDNWAKNRGRGYRDCKKVKSKIFQLIQKYNIKLLNDSGIEIEGIKFWGSPIQPTFHSWAFNRERGAEIKAHWNLIPHDTNVLITHGPPAMILDKCLYDGFNAGCQDLLEKIVTLPDLKLHVFGHIHESRGYLEYKGIKFANASSLDLNYSPYNRPPIIVEVQPKEL